MRKMPIYRCFTLIVRDRSLLKIIIGIFYYIMAQYCIY